MKPAARNALPFVVVCVIALACPAARAATRALFAHGTTDYFWSADVNPNPNSEAPGGVLTTVRLRTAGDFAGTQLQWRTIAEMAEMPVSISNRGSELLVVLDDGQWKIVSESDVRSGLPLPSNARVMALAGDGDDIWAVGGLDLTRDISTAPATVASSKPSTRATTLPSTPHPGRPLALFVLRSGAWNLLGDVPVDYKPEQIAAISLAVLDSRLTLAIVGPSRGVHIFTRSGDQWSGGTDSHITLGDDAQLKLLDVRGKPALWLAAANSSGSLFYAGDGWQHETKLATTDRLKKFDRCSLAYALGQLRLLATDGHGRLAEQLYQPDGSLIGQASEAITAPSDLQNRISHVVQFVVLAAILAWMLGSLRQRPNFAEAMKQIESLNVAPLSTRFAGGVIDMLPLIGGCFAAAIFVARRDPNTAPGTVDFAGAEFAAVYAGIGLYFLHVTLAELMTGRSLGKIITGTKVVSLDGSAASASQILARNVLRLIDLIIVGVPLLAVLQSPLRQRVGDMMAGTLVVTANTEKPHAPENAPRDEQPKRDE